MKTPPIPLTDPRFVYVPSYKTDIRERFDRVRKQIKQTKEKRR